ncbi:RNA polymerase sigma factor [Planctomycetota bacterium]
MITDKYLIWQYNRGHRQALHQIYERYKDQLVTLAAALLSDRDVCEDIVHDVFIGFIRSEGKFQLTGSLRSYLSTCVANRAKNRNKAERRRCYTPLEGIPSPIARAGDPAVLAMCGELSDSLSRALDQLPYEQREVLALRTYGGMTFAAIAAQQETSVYTVQGRYRYALDKLRKLLTETRNQESRAHLRLHHGT